MHTKEKGGAEQGKSALSETGIAMQVVLNIVKEQVAIWMKSTVSKGKHIW